MALVRNHLGSGQAVNTIGVSITPTGLAWMVATIVGRKSSGPTVSAMTCTDTSGVNTWVQIATGLIDTSGSAPATRMTLFRCQAAASPGTFTVTAANVTAIGINIEEFTGADSDFSNASPVATNASGDPSAVLPSAPAITSIVLGSFGGQTTAIPTLPSGYTQILDLTLNSVGKMNICFNQTTTATAAWSSTNTLSCGCLLEIKAAAGAAALSPVPIRSPSDLYMLVR